MSEGVHQLENTQFRAWGIKYRRTVYSPLWLHTRLYEHMAKAKIVKCMLEEATEFGP